MEDFNRKSKKLDTLYKKDAKRLGIKGAIVIMISTNQTS